MSVWIFKFNLTLKVKSRSMKILINVFRIFCPNLVALTWMGDELSRGQAQGGPRHMGTHTQTDATTYLKAKTDLGHCQISNSSCNFVGNEIADHSDVVGASPVGAAPTTSTFSTHGSNRLRRGNSKAKRETLKFGDLVRLILEIWR